MAYITAKWRKQIEDSRWGGIVKSIDHELQRRKKRRHKSRAIQLLEALRGKAARRNGVAMVAIAVKYVSLTRTLPPGVYACAPGPGKNFYLESERLEKGVHCSTLQLGIVHAQIYR
jgi:hypothetical protein